MSNVLYAPVGKSGAGKDYITDKICQDFNMKKVISRTTRKPRFNGENTHLFVSEEQADKEWDIAIARQPVPNKDKIDRYYTIEEDFQDKDFYLLFPTGVKSLKENNIDIQIKTLYIKTPWYIRIFRMIKRGDSISNIIKRLMYETKEFKGFKGDLNFKSNDELYIYFRDKNFLNYTSLDGFIKEK